MKQTFKIVFSVLLFSIMCLNGFAQNAAERTAITGKVVDKDGLGVIGLNVVEKGTKHAVLTDIDGNYKIQVPKGAVLQFTFIGMKTQERTVGTATTINLTMQEDTSTLNEVIVVGYGTQKKSNLTAAVATINPETVQDLPVSNLSEALRGLTPGLSVSNANGSSRPGGAADIQIRQSYGFSKDGNSTIPLIIIDDMIQIDTETGKPSQEAFNRLDPSEIESITILKDGSAAIYGSRASQGAIIVKTKRGKEGKAKFTYYSQFAVNDAISHVKTMNAYEHGIWKNRFLNSNLNPTPANYFSADELEQMKGLNYDWLKEAWKPATQQRHVLNVSGGTDKATYFAGLTYFTQGANLGEQDYNRWNFRTGTNVKVSNSLDFSASIGISTLDVQKSFSKASANLNDSSFGSLGGGEQADYMYLLHMPKYVPWQTTYNGKEYWMSPFPRTDRNLGSANANTTIAGWNYFATQEVGKQIDQEFSYNVNLNLTYKVPFIKGMSVKGSYARSQSSANTEQVQLPYDLLRITNHHLEGNHLLNPNSTYANNGLPETNIRGSRVYYNTDLSNLIQANIFANYARTFGDHDLDAMVGMERSDSEYKNVRLAYEGTGKDYVGSSTTAGPISTNSTADKGEAGTLSYLGRLNYSFKDKYLLSLIFRSDASTKFAPENYRAFFPGAQVGWVVSKENWFADNVSWVDNLKLRYSVGKTGNDNLQMWRWLQLWETIVDKGAQFGSAGGTLGPGVTPRVTPNRDVRWDATLKHNYGVDLAVLDNRLQITADYYFDKKTDMLITLATQAGTPISVGGATAESNYAAINTWGTEFSVNWRDNIKDNFSYNVGVNFGFSNNEIKKYPEAALGDPANNARVAGSSMFTPVWGFKTWKETSTGDGILRTDEDVTNYWNYLTERATAVGGTPNYMNITSVTNMRKGMLAYQDVAGAFDPATGERRAADGKITRLDDYQKLVNQNRTYGFTTNLGMKYKSFYLRSQISTSWGGYNTLDMVKQGTSSAHNDWAHEIFWNDMYDATDNPDGKYPNMGQQDYIFAPSDFWQLNTFRCVIRNLTVGFAIPKEALKSIKIDGLNFGITGNNLWDLYNPYPNKYRNMYDDSSTKYPTLRTWSLSMNVSF
ncbi:SusC/RagA family TonB-linked outer membrane protein [Flavobacterium commune]|uniref:SusC/RagA family TonB-linked outer membrane protein n=1 Tax=Flavobacterium commune TaxID=1306519 RepID=A0A1D9P9J7_9FLAO|nr:SusC/RagA family TonB-linked outer membrane protein [Flavobacterium commune]AOZ99227.1 SusC/RagA family TonB-linked outer membrane protein [Flavobacterium commune]